MKGSLLLLGIPVAVAALVGSVLAAPATAADATPRRVRMIRLEGEIEPALSAYVRRAVERATDDRVDEIVLSIDSPGGRVDSTIEIAEALLAVPTAVRTTAWVAREAISGAAIVALACDEIVLGTTATIGDSQPILPREGGGYVPGGEKAETYLRAQVRRLASAKGRDPVLSEKLVSAARGVVEMRVVGAAPGEARLFVYEDELASARGGDLVAGHRRADLERVAIVVPDGRLLTLTATEAVELGFARRTYESTDAFTAALVATGATIEPVTMSGMERAGRFLVGAIGVLAGIVILCVVLSLYQGIGTPTIVGFVALVLLALASGTAELANGFAWFLVGLGALLLVVEAFLLPGTVILGLLGILVMGAGFLFVGTGTSPGEPGTLSWGTARAFLLQAILAIGATAAIFVALTRLFPRLPFGGRTIMLGASGLPAFGTTAAFPTAVATGARGVAATALRPSGHATFEGSPAPVDVVSEGGFLDASTPLEVVRVEGSRVVVRPTAAPR